MAPFPTPGIETATDPVHSVDDLRLRWLALMSPLGFGDRTLWMAFVGPDRRLQKMLTPLPARSTSDLARIVAVIAELPAGLAEHFEAGTTVAFLLSRPGSGPVTGDDRHWAEVVATAGERSDLPMEPFFRAHDTELVLVETTLR